MGFRSRSECAFSQPGSDSVSPPVSQAAGSELPKLGREVSAERSRGNERMKELRNEGMRVGTVDGLGDGGQPLLSASIRTPRGDMNAGEEEEERKGGGRTETSHPFTLKYVRMPPPTTAVLTADV